MEMTQKQRERRVSREQRKTGRVYETIPDDSANREVDLL